MVPVPVPEEAAAGAAWVTFPARELLDFSSLTVR